MQSLNLCLRKVINLKSLITDLYLFLSFFSKVLEKAMYNQLQEYLNKNSILVEEQFGFRSDSATNKAIYKLINETLDALNNKFIVGGILF